MRKATRPPHFRLPLGRFGRFERRVASRTPTVRAVPLALVGLMLALAGLGPVTSEAAVATKRSAASPALGDIRPDLRDEVAAETDRTLSRYAIAANPTAASRDGR